MTDIKTIMTADPSGAELVALAERTADQLVRAQLTRAKIRDIFTEVRRIEALWEARPDVALRRLNMLKPKLDYSVARAPEVQLLAQVLTQAIDQVQLADTPDERERRFRRFVDFFEAILAYHWAKGGRN